nr:HD domain-containing phosphohydrolase [Exiguobacterium sp. CinTr1]
MAYPITLYHHERWDGTGYNQGLKRRGHPAYGSNRHHVRSDI